MALVLLLIFGTNNLQGQSNKAKTGKATAKKATAASYTPGRDADFLQYTNSRWVDSVMKTLTPEERIAQLIMIPVYSNKNQAHIDSVSNILKTYKVGGMIFFQGGPVRQPKMTNRYQQESKVPLMISIDGEWGLAMRLDSTIRFPYQMALGGIDNERLIYEMGAEIARQCQRLGVHVNFAPTRSCRHAENSRRGSTPYRTTTHR